MYTEKVLPRGVKPDWSKEKPEDWIAPECVADCNDPECPYIHRWVRRAK